MITSYADLLSADAVRSQAEKVTDHVRTGAGVFWLDEDKLADCAQFVASTTLERYPTLEIPYHSRWRHFDAPGSTLRAGLDAHLAGLDPIERARTGFDLVIPSVLLDAGAGPDWTYRAHGAEQPIGRSEGLGLASLAMFLDHSFSETVELQTDAAGLQALSAAQLEHGFQVTASNPLLAVDGRCSVLNALGDAIAARPDVFPNGRLGEMVDVLVSTPELTASTVLGVVLDVLSPIWPSRLERDGIQLGDSWVYEPFGNGLNAVIPFHKLSQWMTYSLVETLVRSGIEVGGVEELTGLPEYRNGGLLYETGVVGLHDESMADQSHEPGSQLIIEWRALTISQLDAVAHRVRQVLDRPDLLLAEILEGGTWAAGRRLAFERDPAGRPPLKLKSDGTVF